MREKDLVIIVIGCSIFCDIFNFSYFNWFYLFAEYDLDDF